MKKIEIVLRELKKKIVTKDQEPRPKGRGM